MSGPINREIWVKALGDAARVEAPDPTIITSREFAEMLGISQVHARRKLETLIQHGSVTVTTKRIRQLNGAIRTVPGYKLRAP